MRLLDDTRSRTARVLAKSTKGVVFVEYVALLTLVTVTGAVAVVGLGVPLMRLYRFAQVMVALPIP